MSADASLLAKKVERQKRQIELLEQLIEDRSRDIFQVNEELQRASRRAGMADVATSVLHNVGNALNSVNVSANMIASIARGSKAGGLAKALALLRAQPDPGRFLTEDARGKKLLDYLDGIAAQIEIDRVRHAEEVAVLEKNIEHIKAIIVAQQSLARGGAMLMKVSVRAMISDAIKMAVGAISSSRVDVTSAFDDLAFDEMTVDRHKLFQILMNLIKNAADALRPRSSERRLHIRVSSRGDTIVFEVEDNGVGIPAENLTKVFAHGFTTKTDGHGFGLHSSANAAREMGGRLSATSAGPDCGATFTLELPREAEATTESPSAAGAATSACPPGAATASP